MKKLELNNFYNEGFGWICKNCEKDLKTVNEEKSRLMREGEAESKNPDLSNKAMAKWTDSEQKTLICPRCETTEFAKNPNR
ncbi:MAG: hypothetical protein ACR2MD_12170 [Aridibacter sp.]